MSRLKNSIQYIGNKTLIVGKGIGKGARAIWSGTKSFTKKSWSLSQPIRHYTGRGLKASGRGLWSGTKGTLGRINNNKITSTFFGLILAGAIGGYWYFSRDSRVETPVAKGRLEQRVDEGSIPPGLTPLPTGYEEMELAWRGKVHNETAELYDIVDSNIDMISVSSLEHRLAGLHLSSKTTWEYFYDSDKRRVIKAVKSRRNRDFTSEVMEYDINDKDEISKSILERATVKCNQIYSVIENEIFKELGEYNRERDELPPPEPVQTPPPEPTPYSYRRTKPYNPLISRRVYTPLPEPGSLRDILSRPKDYHHPFNIGANY
ncbi:hypothetical protein J4221_02305 [Candidatus Pacearchaeota archaeon]|nr:hypothetical protein [Candidatus Pacearchaeota archaeon]